MNNPSPRCGRAPSPPARPTLVKYISVLLLLGLAWGLGVRADTPLILAVHPYQPYATLMRKYTPLADYLGEVLERKVTVRIGRDYQDHINYTGRDRVDIALMGPASYVEMTATYGAKPLLARFEINRKPVFQGVFIARQDSALQDLQALRGKRLAFGDRESTMSHLVPRFVLRQAGIGVEDLADYQFLGSHDNVALAVLAGDFDAGAVKEEVFEKYRQRGLKVISYTPPLSEHVLVARSTLAPHYVQAIRTALYALRDSPRGRAILRGIKKTMTGMVPAKDADYDDLRGMLQSLREPGVQ